MNKLNINKSIANKKVNDIGINTNIIGKKMINLSIKLSIPDVNKKTYNISTNIYIINN